MDADDRRLLTQVAILGGAASLSVLLAAVVLALAVRIFQAVV